MDYSGLSKEISYALRHAPWEFELELDHEGWVDTNQLLAAIRMDKKWATVTESDLRKMIEASDKKRHELGEGTIRALYGHSVPQKIQKKDGVPPELLYHGTARPVAEQILSGGLRPMGRQYVHMSIDTDTANIVGKRKASNPVLLRIQAGKAAAEGVKFYRGNNTVWLADYVSGKYISMKLTNQ